MVDLTGKRFGRWTVLELAEIKRYGKNYHYYWRCRCDCGAERLVDKTSLTAGKSRSCGCLNREKPSSRATHGMSSTSVYHAWHTMKQRCFDPNCKAYPLYGGRGITVCDEWRDDFQAFFDHVSKLAHFGEGGYTLDRIDNGGNYEPGNVRWATRSEQCRNRRSNIVVEYQGQQMTLTEAAELSGIKAGTLLYRVRTGNPIETIFRPLRHILSDDERHEIKTIFKKGDRNFGERALARKYGVAPRTINHIVNDDT